MSLSTIDSLKNLGNREFRRQNYREAIRLYTQALDSVDDAIPIETQRILFANRSQASIFYGATLEGLRDVNHALSPQYTRQDSPKSLTAKCRYRRAKILCSMARYDEALADYGEFATIMEETGVEISGGELELKRDLDSKVAAGDDSEERRRGELLRAIDARGFMLWTDYRATFPLPPPNMEERLGPNYRPYEMSFSFDTIDSEPDRDLPDPNLTPILIPVTVQAPYYYPNPNSQTPFSGRRLMPEHATMGSLLGMFSSLAISGQNRESIPLAVKQERDGVLIIISSRGRLFKIPRETTIKDAIAGVRWPHQHNAPVFEDLRRAPRKRNDEIDGVDLMMAMVEIYVVANDKLGAFVDRIERGFAEFAT